MPASGSNSSSQLPLDILKVAKCLQRPPEDAAAAKEIIQGVDSALLPFAGSMTCGPKVKGKAAAQLSSCIAAALQCAGWLTAARAANPDIDEPGARLAISRCLMFAMWSISRVEVGIDLLKAVLRPTADGKAPGGCGRVQQRRGVMCRVVMPQQGHENVNAAVKVQHA
jgi:hypothetical protein